MATWNGTKPTKYSEYTGADYADTEVVWSYGTVSDTLTLHYKQGEYSDWGTTHEAKEFTKHMSREQSLAVLEQLIDWAEQYEGEHVVDNILKRIRE